MIRILRINPEFPDTPSNRVVFFNCIDITDTTKADSISEAGLFTERGGLNLYDRKYINCIF